MLKVAVVGMGGIGNRHAEIHAADSLAQLVAVCDVIKEKADAAAEKFGVPAFYSVDDMLANVDIDIVDVCTGGVENGSDHYEPTMKAFEAGKHVLCEKPISNNIEEAREMVKTAREKGLYFGINLNHRFSPLCYQAKEWMDQGLIGKPLFCNMALWISNPKDDPQYFHIRALHPHSIDIMRFFCGPVKRVQAFFTKAPGRNSWSTISVNFEFENGAVGHLTGSYDMTVHHPMERCEVGGTEGRFVIENVIEDLILFPHNSRERKHVHLDIFSDVTNFGDTFRLRIHRFLEQVSQGVPPEQIEGSGAEGLAAQEVIEAAIRSHENGNVAVEVPNQ